MGFVVYLIVFLIIIAILVAIYFFLHKKNDIEFAEQYNPNLMDPVVENPSQESPESSVPVSQIGLMSINGEYPSNIPSNIINPALMVQTKTTYDEFPSVTNQVTSVFEFTD